MGKYFVSRLYNEIFLNEGDFDLIEGECALAKDLTFNEAYALVLITAKNVPDFRSVYLRIRRDEVVSFAL